MNENTNEKEIIDILIAIDNYNFIVEQKYFDKGSIEAEKAKQTMAILAYKGMKEGYGIYRRYGNQLIELHPDVDYPMILELERVLESQGKSNSMGGR